ncbi:hypothetical protein B7P43_G18202 [Cryptotermes secundus]|uniref:Uncharacterized protein n=1 Tax=Cryptotermes secundus TaxID=105785 RepID=A0A2J7Q9C0_9NEOP|nr:hypothetical protein B7P43_G18202 [Cryptotermes secundus]
MMDDIAEQQDVAKEISEAISNPVAFGQDVDEDELERELEELEQEELDKELLGVGPSVDELPSVPTTDIARPTPTKSKASGYLYLQFMLRLQKVIVVSLIWHTGSVFALNCLLSNISRISN